MSSKVLFQKCLIAALIPLISGSHAIAQDAASIGDVLSCSASTFDNKDSDRRMRSLNLVKNEDGDIDSYSRAVNSFVITVTPTIRHGELNGDLYIVSEKNKITVDHKFIFPKSAPSNDSQAFIMKSGTAGVTVICGVK